MCGDQHLAVLVQHGLEALSDGPYAFTCRAIVNTINSRWWHPEDEQPGQNPVANSPLSWAGEYEAGLGNLIRMLAYANPEDGKDETQRADGYGIVRFNRKDQTITFECWSRFVSVDDAMKLNFPVGL